MCMNMIAKKKKYCIKIFENIVGKGKKRRRTNKSKKEKFSHNIALNLFL